MKTIAHYPDSLSAHFARTRLENAGIAAFVLDEASAVSTVYGSMIPGEGQVKLGVAGEDAERAMAVLFEMAQEHPVICPQCDSDNVREREPQRRFAGLFAMLLFALHLSRHKLVCENCGWRWSGRQRERT